MEYRIIRGSNQIGGTITDIPIRPMSEIKGLQEIGKNGKTWGDYIKQAVNLRDGEVKNIQISGINHLRREIMKRL